MAVARILVTARAAITFLFQTAGRLSPGLRKAITALINPTVRIWTIARCVGSKLPA